MGLRVSALKLLLPYLPAERVLSLSYPDMVMSQDELQEATGFRTERESDSGRWHGKDHPLPETAEAFRLLGTKEFRCVDIVRSRNVEEIVDLNHPADLGQYDLVLDPGTTEHCFNIGQAIINAANAVKVGGLILHTPPLTMLNHGFYCLMPTLFHDFYGQNGWEVLALQMTNGNESAPAPATKRFSAEPELSLYCLARRTIGGKLIYPTQYKYQVNPLLK